VEDAKRRAVSSNFYWLSTREDVLDWEKTKWYYTPTRSHADLKALARSRPRRSSVVAGRRGGPESARAGHVENTGKALAFQVHLKLTSAGRRGGPARVLGGQLLRALPGREAGAPRVVPRLGGKGPCRGSRRLEFAEDLSSLGGGSPPRAVGFSATSRLIKGAMSRTRTTFVLGLRVDHGLDPVQVRRGRRLVNGPRFVVVHAADSSPGTE
jgi:hypothetical protein